MSGEPAKLSENVDLSTREDAGIARKLIRRHKRWRNDHLHDAMIDGIDKLLHSDDMKDVAAGARVMATIEEQNQRDELEQAKYDRLDEGKSVDTPTEITITVPDVRRKELDG
jgi:uncharacterized secreted protein with C-terminal beta-propeller domain